MRLYNLKVEGFRRFETAQNLNISTKLTAIVGPNEAGKTSLLKALSYFSDDSPIDDEDSTNLGSTPTVLRLSFFLDSDDLEAAALREASWLDVVKRPDGQRKYAIRPYPKRELAKRASAVKAIDRLRSATVASARLEELAPGSRENLDRARDVLSSSSDQLESATLSLVQGLIDEISDHTDNLKWVSIKDLLSTFAELLDFEEDHDPHQFATNALSDRLPPILNFTQEYRDIELPYNLTAYKHAELTHRKSPSRPLAEILRLSEIDMDELKKAAVTKNGCENWPSISS
jgi:predicted ATP-dependent endonuclease of OLD family